MGFDKPGAVCYGFANSCFRRFYAAGGPHKHEYANIIQGDSSPSNGYERDTRPASGHKRKSPAHPGPYAG